MKALYLAPLPPPAGGIATWAIRMKNAELKNGWTVQIIDEKVTDNRDLKAQKVNYNLAQEARRCFVIWKNLWKALDDKDAAIVHSSIPAALTSMSREVVCAIITRLRRRKFIIHFRCTVPNMVKSKASLAVFRILTGLSNGVIALNSASEDFTKEHSKTYVQVIPNFVSLSEVIENKTSTDSFIVLYVGTVIPDKGCLTMIQAAKECPEYQFRLVGAVGKEMKHIDLPANVIMTGEATKDAVREELSAASVFVFASSYIGEGFSNSLAEAMAAKLPCIVTDWAANADMIEDKGGFIIEKDDVAGMVESLRTLQADSVLRTRMGNWNAQKVRERYSQEYITGQYVDLYESVLTKRRGGELLR